MHANKDKAKQKDALPEHFDSLEQAGEFWDAHSSADYWDQTDEAALEFELRESVFYVPVENRLYYRVKEKALQENRSTEEMVSLLLERELS